MKSWNCHEVHGSYFPEVFCSYTESCSWESSTILLTSYFRNWTISGRGDTNWDWLVRCPSHQQEHKGMGEPAAKQMLQACMFILLSSFRPRGGSLNSLDFLNEMSFFSITWKHKHSHLLLRVGGTFLSHVAGHLISCLNITHILCKL